MFVYQIINKINGKLYIGQTISELKQRFAHHCFSSNGCVALKNAIDKYGKENFEIKSLSRCSSLEEMNHREQYYIKLFNTLTPNGYNLRTGGRDNYVFSEESKQKMSKSHVGKPGYWTGKNHTSETKDKLSKNHMGSQNPNFGKPKTLETKEKMSMAQSNRKAVKCNETGTILRSLGLMAKTLNLPEQNIRAVLKGRRKSCGGFTFSYCEGVELHE